VIVDHHAGRLVWAGEGRTETTIARLFDELGPTCAAEVALVTMDMSANQTESRRQWIIRVEAILFRGAELGGGPEPASPGCGRVCIRPAGKRLRMVRRLADPCVVTNRLVAGSADRPSSLGASSPRRRSRATAPVGQGSAQSERRKRGLACGEHRAGAAARAGHRASAGTDPSMGDASRPAASSEGRRPASASVPAML
jgi:hypothetical protein